MRSRLAVWITRVGELDRPVSQIIILHGAFFKIPQLGNLLGNFEEVRHLDLVVLKEASGSRASRKSYSVFNARVPRYNPVHINRNTTSLSDNVIEQDITNWGNPRSVIILCSGLLQRDGWLYNGHTASAV